MRRLTESVAGIVLLAITLLLGAIGLLADLAGQSDPPTLFGGAAVFGIAAIAIALDEHRRSAEHAGHWTQALFGRALIVIALALEIVALVLGLQESPYRSLWLGLAIILALDGLAVTVDTRRLVISRDSANTKGTTADAIPGAVAGAIALSFGVIGFAAGLLDNPHAPAWLYAGVIVALIANAFMFDEDAQVGTTTRAERALPGRKVTPFQR